MKRFFVLMVVCALVLPGMVYAAETETHTWTDENGVKHIRTITRETSKTPVQGDGPTPDQDRQQWQEQKTTGQTAVKKSETPKKTEQKTGTDAPAGTKTDGSFQFDIDSHKPKF